jgi:dCMP deaminase
MTSTPTPVLRRDKMSKYLRLARFIAREFSKDPRTQVGALVLDATDFAPHSFGYNGMPRKCDDTAPERLVAPEKYLWFSHAEENAITNAAAIGIPLRGCWLVCTMLPCMTCARMIVNARIQGVVTVKPSEEHLSRWGDQFERTEALFRECGVSIVYLEESELGNPTVDLLGRPGAVTTCC